MQFTLSFGIGLALGFLNWVFWAVWARKILRQKRFNKGFFSLIAFLKLGLLGWAIWLLLSKFDIHPIGFLLGFTLVVMATLMRGLKWN